MMKISILLHIMSHPPVLNISVVRHLLVAAPPLVHAMPPSSRSRRDLGVSEPVGAFAPLV